VTESRLPNGARIRLEARPHAASVAVVLRLAGGTREETDAAAGQLHLLEHLLLRRTAQRSVQALVDCIASLGGEVNAETGREHLALVGRAPAPRVAELAGLLVECLCEPAFDDADLALERGAIAAERTFLGQMPPMEALLRLAWPAHPLGRPLLPAEAPQANVATLRALWSTQAVGARLTVAVSGACDAAAVQAALAPLASLPPGAPPPVQDAPRFVPGRYGELLVEGPARLLWALPCSPFDTARGADWELAALLLEHVLTERLRTQGHAYAVLVQPHLFADAGLIAIQVQASAGAAATCLDAVEGCIDALAADGATAHQFDTARRAWQARAAFALDDPLARAHALAHPLAEPASASGPLVPSNGTLRLVL
jgi:predicted Zn-dependent peptidase